MLAGYVTLPTVTEDVGTAKGVNLDSAKTTPKLSLQPVNADPCHPWHKAALTRLLAAEPIWNSTDLGILSNPFPLQSVALTLIL